jgi:pseudouridine kinase
MPIESKDSDTSETPGGSGPVVVVGSSVLDVVGRPLSGLLPRSSAPGVVRLSPGGVGRNVAENLARLGVEVTLITAVGDDAAGRQLLEQAEAAGVRVGQALVEPGERTGLYLAVLDPQGNLEVAVDDVGLVRRLTPDAIQGKRHVLEDAQAIFFDANLPPASVERLVSIGRAAAVPLAADPTSVSLAAVLRPHLKDLWLITPNAAEAEAIVPHAVPHADRNRAVDAARHLVAEGVGIALVTMAEFGVGYASAETSGHIPAINTEVVDPTGAGDAQTAAVLFGLLNGIPLDESVRLGVSAAALTLRTLGSVVPELSLERLYEVLR